MLHKGILFFMLSMILLSSCTTSYQYAVWEDDLYFNPRTDQTASNTTKPVNNSPNVEDMKEVLENDIKEKKLNPNYDAVPLVRREQNMNTFNSDTYSASPFWTSPIDNNNAFNRNPYQSILGFSFNGIRNSLPFFRSGNPFWGNNTNNVIWYDSNASKNNSVQPVKRPKKTRGSYVAPRPRKNNSNSNVTPRNQSKSYNNNNSYSAPKNNYSKPSNYQVAPRGNSRRSGGSSPSKTNSRPRSRR